jgi:prevent-host-death family protein
MDRPIACRAVAVRYRSVYGYRRRPDVKFLSTRDLRNRPGYVRELARDDDLVLTANGKPIAILVGVDDDEFEETARVIRQVKAQRALTRMRRQATQRGLDRLPPKAIDSEIRAVRSKRKSR